MLNLTQLNYFKLVAQTKNFAAAAKMAHITQPALSNSIRTLEEKIRLQLFDRNERPVRVTSSGKNLLRRIDSLIMEARQLEKEIGFISQGMSGTLKIGMTAHSSASIGGRILGDWLTENGRMSADITIADTLILVEKLRQEELDLIIGDSRDISEKSLQLEIMTLPTQQGQAYCRRGHPALAIENLTFTDLLPYRFAGSHFTKTLLDHLTQALNLQDGNSFQLAIESDNISLVRDATINSDLIMLATDKCLRAEVDVEMIAELRVDLKTPTTWQCVTLKNSIAHPALASLKKAILCSLT